MTRETKEQVIELFKSDVAERFKEQQQRAASDASIAGKATKLMKDLMSRFETLFSLKSKKLAVSMVEGAKATSKTSLASSLKELSGGLSIKTSLVPKGMEDVMQASIEENVSLIKALPGEYLNKVTGTVMRSITSGISIGALTQQIQKYAGQTERRAKNTALDQVRKAYNNLNKQRLQAVGVGRFEWLHSGGGQHPRKSHQAMNGKIFSFDDLPVINKEQVDAGSEAPVRGIPGQAINCGCTMNPVIEFEDGEEK